MADSDVETLPNGTATLTEEEEERLKQRPADIDADVREMERRKRVEALMSSKLFREELERVLDQQITDGGDAPLLQRIREMVGGRLHSGTLRGPSCVLPINDIRGIEGVGYEKGEKILRCKLAAVYRLVDLFGWTQTGVNGQITARLNTAVESVLTTPRGLLPHEVTASSLVKVDMQGAVQDQGTTNFPINVEGFSLHAAVHAARPDIRCVLHVRSGSALAVSCLQRGLLPLCYEAAALGEYATHRAPLGILDNEEKDKLVRALGPHSKVLMLSNAGALCCGATLEEAFHRARLLTAAADVQLRLAASPPDQLCLIDEESRKQIYDAVHKPPADAVKWRVGGEEFEALMRMLDNAGFRTGYIYRHPLIKNDVPRPKNDVEVPPAVSSLGYLLEEEELYKQGYWKKGQGKTGERTRWLNSPNVYQKVEVLETGTTDPKKITKWVDANTDEWVQDGSPAHSSTPVKIDTLQFVPKNTNPKEFKKLQQLIKDNRRADKISAGPQSHILEGVTWDEASKLVAEDAANTHTGDHVVLMGAASKGIIQRGYQHNATMYSAPYARNPFDHVTDTEIEDYRRAVERKGKNDYDTDLSESEAISGAQITSPASMPSETEEESRDEHRVLRIETMQAPVRSQPEVVLSDVDTTDFLAAERAHADRTKDTRDPNPFSDDDVFAPSAVKSGVHSVITARAHHRVVGRDPNLLSDDEVFLDSAASTVTSSMTSGMTSGVTSGVTSPQPPATVVIRAQHAAVAQTVARGTKGTNRHHEALSANKRSIHDYTRSANFDNIVQIYESPKKNDDSQNCHPKCKISLHSRLNDVDRIASSRSSLYSIASLEWDGKAKSDYGFRTRSLPRQRVCNPQRLYRTRSHGGFINAYIRDPEPKHYHLPRCRSCGATSVSYAWHLTRDEKSPQSHTKTAVYLSVDNIPQSCSEATEISVKVTEKVVPVFKVEKLPEFVESQEFTEDNYLGELGSFSSDNQTVIEKPGLNADAYDVKVGKIDIETEVEKEEEMYRAEYVQIDAVEDVNDTLETTEGEYHSFTDDFEEAYESPVKELVEKDIRDYSVPIDFYCDDYMRKSENSPIKSPNRARDGSKMVLEPILEESKSSYGDDSGNMSNGSKKDSGVQALAEEAVEAVLDAATTTVELEAKIEPLLESRTEPSDNVAETIQQISPTEKPKDAKQITVTDSHAISQVSERNVTIEISGIAANVSDNNETKHSKIDNSAKSSIEYSVASSTNELVTLDSTVEFEKYEAVSELLLSVLNKIDYDSVHKDIFLVLGKRNKEIQISGENQVIHKDNMQECQVEMQRNEKAFVTKADNEILEVDDNVPFPSIEINKLKQHSKEEVIIKNAATQDSAESLSLSGESCDDNLAIAKLIHNVQSGVNLNTTDHIETNFSITKLIDDLESNAHLNETILTETSDSGISESFKIAESVMYYIFDSVFLISNSKNKKKNTKNVVTVVDPEDIFFTARAIWPNFNLTETAVVKAKDNDITNEKKSGPHIHDVPKQNTKVLEGGKNPTLLHEFKETVASNEKYVQNNIVASTPNEVVIDFSLAENVIECEAGNYEDIERFDYRNPDNQGDLNNNIEQQLGGQLDEPIQDLNNTTDVDKSYTTSDDSSTDGEDCRDLSENGTEIAEDIVYKIFNSILHEEENENYQLSTANFNNINETFIEQSDDLNKNLNRGKYLNETYNELNICSNREAFNETVKETNTDIALNLDATFIEQIDEMNVAFVHDAHASSSPTNGCKIFESCSESPISNPSNSFLGEDLTVLYDNNDNLLGSPFVKRAPFISMSQTENSGGIKYWLSFDDSITVRSLTDSANERIWKKAKKIDETIPSFYGVDFVNNDGSPNSLKNETFPMYRKKSVLIGVESKLKIDACTSYHNNEDGHKDDWDANEVDVEIQACTSANSSKSYDTCETFLPLNSPQKKLLYEVQKRQRLYSSWPPFEHTIFYRIISKFRMSESFDPSDLESGDINSFQLNLD